MQVKDPDAFLRLYNPRTRRRSAVQRARAVEGKVWSSFKKISLSQAINRSINTVAFSDRNSKANTFPESDGKELRPLLRKEAADYT